MNRRVMIALVLALALLAGSAQLSSLSQPSASVSGNLLTNPSMEAGTGDSPDGWTPVALPGGTGTIQHSWDNAVAHEGSRSLRMEATGTKRGIWSQMISVHPESVYEISGYVAFEDLGPSSSAYLQVVFHDHEGRRIEFVNLASHRAGGRDFDLDFPARMLIRAPGTAATAEINGYLEGDGILWLDELTFAPAPLGTIRGRVTTAGNPLPDVRVYLWGDPWGKAIEAITDPDGNYELHDIPVSHPRYIAIAERDGYQTLPVGDIDVVCGQAIEVNFNLQPGTNPIDTLKIGYGSVAHSLPQAQFEVPDFAPRAVSLADVPDIVQPYLVSDDFITASDPTIQRLAADILAALPDSDRGNASAVAWAVFCWISTHINHDAVYGNRQPYLDVTSGIWQTIQPGGWCWGRSFYDWLYRPAELLAEQTGICIEHSWLSAALLRALNIPARARVGSAQFWLDTGADGTWFGFSTNGGSNTYRETGRLGAGFGGSTLPVFFSATSVPVLHEDWNWDQPGLWREQHPWGEVYPSGEEGLSLAIQDLEAYANTGVAPAGPGRRRPGEAVVEISYAQIELNLWALGEQRRIDVRFPAPTNSVGTEDTNEWAYWTNHPECVVDTYEESLPDSGTGILERWRHVVFDVSRLMGEST